MKTKKINNKLSLNKQTIASLNETSMNQVNGGAPWTAGCTTTCNSAFTLCECFTPECTRALHPMCTFDPDLTCIEL